MIARIITDWVGARRDAPSKGKKVLGSPDEYRRKAKDCLRLAAQATDPKVQSAYVDAARSYRHLAAEIELWEESKHHPVKDEPA
jgi:hypothetical protein